MKRIGAWTVGSGLLFQSEPLTLRSLKCFYSLHKECDGVCECDCHRDEVWRILLRYLMLAVLGIAAYKIALGLL